jgi:hypothetical protein
MPGNARYAIITPYYKEEQRLIERCINSVRAQTVPADHFLVSDGHPQAWIDDASVRHFKLDRNHGDVGNTPRGVGGLIAIAEGYSGIGLLDADNWLEPNHVETCLDAAEESAPCDYVIARRTFRRPDETAMPIPEQEGHVDTNCFFFLQGSFCVIPHWGMMPNAYGLGLFGDRYFYAALQRQPFNFAKVSRATVNYHCMWASLYWMIGENPPAEAHWDRDLSQAEQWLESLESREKVIFSRLTGGSPAAMPRMGSFPAEADCPCGSGKGFGFCHGIRLVPPSADAAQ